MNRIEIKDVTKRYGEVAALDNMSLTLEGDQIIGLLGRNGAGKTTLLNTITNRIFTTSGEIRVNGELAAENDRAQQQMFMMGEQGFYPAGMRVEQVFKWTSDLHGGAFDRAYADKLCGLFGLDTRKKVKQLSTGYGSIYKIIAALSLRVPILLLDEPVLGLDANHRELFYRLLLENYAENPRMIVISTHLIEEISSLIEDVVIIKSGKIIRHMPSEELLASGHTVSGPAAAVNAYTAGKQILGADTLGGLKTAYILGEAAPGQTPEGLEITRMDLQKLFIRLTNE